MNNAIEAMLQKYAPKNNLERENAIKEILQEVALAGLSRGGFFEKAAFYGGSCLRIFHGLDRFSEDLDFALVDKKEGFRLEDYFPSLKQEFESYGIHVEIETKATKTSSNIDSAFLKGSAPTLMMTFFPQNEEAKRIVFNQKIKIKFEIDLDNPSGGKTEYRFRMLPTPYEARVFDAPTLFSGKIHAILCREYKMRVKGRDYYDYLFYVARNTPINLEYLSNKLKNTGGVIPETEILTIDKVKALLRQRFANTDYESAKEDVAPFIENKEPLVLWKKELFLSTLDELTFDTHGS